MSGIIRTVTVVLVTFVFNAPAQNVPARTLGETAFLPDALTWAANPNVPVPGVQNAPGVGDPAREGLYTSFGKLAYGVRFPAHTHPDARVTTVLSGVMVYGVGERFADAELRPYPAGSVVYTPAGTPHVMWAKDGEIVVQETGYGPTGLEFSAGTE